MKLTPKNWSSFQHYKNRSPVWIKLHRSLLDNYDFIRLPLASKALAPFLWLLASEYQDGQIDASEEELAFRLRVPVSDLKIALKPLIDSGFFECASGLLADGYQDACLEKRREESEESASVLLATASTTLAEKNPEQQYFARFKEICGAKSGGLAAKLLRAKEGNVSLARAAIEVAATKQAPSEYIGAVLRGASDEKEKFSGPRKIGGKWVDRW